MKYLIEDEEKVGFPFIIHFHKKNGIVNNKITFSSSYYCYNLLPKDIIMEKIK